MSEGGFQAVGSVLSAGKEAVREEMQKKTSWDILKIINKPSDRKPMSQEETELIRLWIVGDADSYVRAENNFDDWTKEYQRLATVLAGYENKECGVEDLLKLSGLLEDAVRVSYDIANFIEKKDRLDKFQLAVSDGLDQQERDTLASVLASKFRSTGS